MYKTIGIVGGGQLGRMLTLAAKPLGFHVIVVDPNKNSPAAQVGAEEITAELYDQNALRQLAERVDCITVEIEHLDVNVLDEIAALGKPVHPAPKTIRLIQDKLAQKEFLHQARIPVAPFLAINSMEDAEKALKKFGGKMLIKTRFGAYDGRGNMLIKNRSEIKKAFELFTGKQLYAEKFVPFKKELAVMIARSTDGQSAVYPIVETVHERNICIEVIAPAQINKQEQSAAKKLAAKVANVLEGAGVFGIEMFLTNDGKVLVNEIAPRVHNSGHYSIEACHVSQFEQHIRAVSGLPLGNTSLKVPAAVMINILGERDGDTDVTGLEDALGITATSIHLYGKSPTKIDRKMGHITATADTIELARKRARKARKTISL